MVADYWQRIVGTLEAALRDDLTERDPAYRDLVANLARDIGITGGYTPNEYRDIQDAINSDYNDRSAVNKAFPHLDSDLSSYVRALQSNSVSRWQPYTLSSMAIQEAGRTVDRVERATEQPVNAEPISLSGGSEPSGLSTLVSRLGLIAVAAIVAPAIAIGLYLWYNRADWRKSLWQAAGLFLAIAIGGGYLVYYLLTSYAGIYRG